jgi:hypothetical protein
MSIAPNAAVEPPRDHVSSAQQAHNEMARLLRACVDLSRSARTACYVRLPPNPTNRDCLARDELYAATDAEQRGLHAPKLMASMACHPASGATPLTRCTPARPTDEQHTAMTRDRAAVRAIGVRAATNEDSTEHPRS